MVIGEALKFIAVLIGNIKIRSFKSKGKNHLIRAVQVLRIVGHCACAVAVGHVTIIGDIPLRHHAYVVRIRPACIAVFTPEAAAGFFYNCIVFVSDILAPAGADRAKVVAVGLCLSELQRKDLSCEVHIQHRAAVGRDRHSIAALVIPQLAVRLDIGHILLGRLAEAADQGAAGVVMLMRFHAAAVAGSNMGMGAG